MFTAARTASHGQRAVVVSGPRTQPFDRAEDVWLWTMAALIARREGARYGANKGLVSRPCDPDDVVKCLDFIGSAVSILLMQECCVSGASVR
jgi:hypothetical protein